MWKNAFGYEFHTTQMNLKQILDFNIKVQTINMHIGENLSILAIEKDLLG